jgi:type VI protein secretion system component VasK
MASQAAFPFFDGQRLHYFNQMESWQRFTWPGTGEYQGASLTWTELDAGPLALLRLRGFRLPAQIFLDERTAFEDTKERL